MQKKIFFLCTLLCMRVLKSVVSTNDFDANIISAHMDATTGVYYVGTEASPGNVTLAQIEPVENTDLPEGEEVHSSAEGLPIKYLSVQNDGTRSPQIVAATYTAGSAFNRLMMTNGSSYYLSDIVLDSSGSDFTYAIQGSYGGLCPPDGTDDGEIIGIDSSSLFVFVLVKRLNCDWLLPGSAINVYNINRSSMELSQVDQELVDARDFLVGTNSNVVQDAGTTPHIHYNNDLETLYVANSFVQSQSGATDGVRSLSAYKVDQDSGVLTYSALHLAANTADSTGWGDGTTSATKNIVGVVGADKNLSVHALTTMKTSRNTYYLIIVGGHGTAAETGNTVRALPLVGPDSQYTGMLANASTSHLLSIANDTTQLHSEANTAAIVGSGNLPWNADATITDIQSIGNCVYVSTNDNTLGTAGIYYSRAILNANGKITRWTSWKKAAPSNIGNSSSDGSVDFFRVNPFTSKVWAVPSDYDSSLSGAQTTVVRTTAWDTVNRRVLRHTRTTGLSPTECAALLFPNGPHVSRAFNTTEHNIPVHLTMHIGTFTNDKQGIVFVRQEETDTVGNATNVKSVELPNTASRALSCGLTNWINNDDRVLIPLIGTHNGLFAFVHTTDNHGADPSGTGDPTHHADDLSAGFWPNGEWKQVLPNIFKENVTAIHSQGKGLYITVRGTSLSDIKDRVYRFDLDDITANTILNATPVLVAESGKAGFPLILRNAVPFPVINSAGIDQDIEQVYIGTNSGVSHSKIATGAHIASEDTFQEPVWSTVRQTENLGNLFLTSDSSNLISGSIDKNSLVYITHLTLQHNDINIPTIETETETIIPDTPSTPDVNINQWTDGGRELLILNTTLFGKDHTQTRKYNISSDENSTFRRSRPQNITLQPSGIIEVTTTRGIAQLR